MMVCLFLNLIVKALYDEETQTKTADTFANAVVMYQTMNEIRIETNGNKGLILAFTGLEAAFIELSDLKKMTKEEQRANLLRLFDQFDVPSNDDSK